MASSTQLPAVSTQATYSNRCTAFNMPGHHRTSKAGVQAGLIRTWHMPVHALKNQQLVGFAAQPTTRCTNMYMYKATPHARAHAGPASSRPWGLGNARGGGCKGGGDLDSSLEPCFRILKKCSLYIELRPLRSKPSKKKLVGWLVGR